MTENLLEKIEVFLALELDLDMKKYVKHKRTPENWGRQLESKNTMADCVCNLFEYLMESSVTHKQFGVKNWRKDQVGPEW